MSLDGLAPLRDVIRRHDIGARKALGQNFLLDLNLTAKVARAAEPLAAHTIVEIGPGPGGLTRALLALGARRVIAVERDRRCLSALEEIAAHYPGRLTLIEGDALSSDVRPLLEGDAPARIVANLPYNISTPLLVGWLSQEPWPPWFDMMVLMFQREVAERIAAPPRSDAYGRLSVLAQWRCETKILFDIPPRAFVPAPKVTSTVVRLVPRATPLECARARLEQVTAAAFGQRRKMLRQSLKAACADPLAVLAEAGIAPTRRAEDLDVAQFVALARLIGPRERDGL